MIPGEIIVRERSIILNENRQSTEITVANTGDRPVQVGSHFHFFEANRLLRFDREKAYGMRLDIPSGTAVRFEPGEEKTVSLVGFGGANIAMGNNGLVNGKADEANRQRALENARQKKFI